MPEQVLSMSLPTFKAVLEGYQEHLFDLKCLTLYVGYWVGYYNNAKHATSLGEMLKKLFKEHLKLKNKKQKELARPEVDVEGFLQQERSFKSRMQRR